MGVVIAHQKPSAKSAGKTPALSFVIVCIYQEQSACKLATSASICET